MGHLIMSMGKTCHLVAEVLGFLNHDEYPLYHNHQNFATLSDLFPKGESKRIHRVSLICTNDSFQQSKIKLEEFIGFHQLNVQLDYHILTWMHDVSSEDDMLQMRNIIYSVVYFSTLENGHNNTYLCLTGGRKTMSSDIQQAGIIFGCRAMIHILAEGNVDFSLHTKPKDIPADTINRINPVIYLQPINPSNLSELIDPNSFTLPPHEKHVNEYRYLTSDNSFVSQIQQMILKQDALAFNHYYAIHNAVSITPFQALNVLRPSQIRYLKEDFIADNNYDSMYWIVNLPKTDLHSHLGGFLSISDAVQIAGGNLRYISYSSDLKFTEGETKRAVQQKNLQSITTLWEKIRKLEKSLRWQYASVFLNCFENSLPLLETFLYGKRLDQKSCYGMGLENYERIGDIQGSSLLQTEAAIRTICKKIVMQSRYSNLLYQEIRCSPLNYTTQLTAEEIIEIMWDELKDKDCLFKLILIGSRHREMELIQKHADLCLKFKKKASHIGDFICGFDLAGPEDITAVNSLRTAIHDILQSCIKVTIHAGETTNVENIWDAIYNLNADRIGHGLFLKQAPNLINKLIDNRIAIEMCPTSNYNISHFRDTTVPETANFEIYPLAEYLKQGLKACICTDDQGISRTEICMEYLKACQMTPGGISKWDILGLIRNGFVSAFISKSDKQKLIIKAEEMILDFIEMDTCIRNM